MALVETNEIVRIKFSGSAMIPRDSITDDALERLDELGESMTFIVTGQVDKLTVTQSAAMGHFDERPMKIETIIPVDPTEMSERVIAFEDNLKGLQAIPFPDDDEIPDDEIPD